MEQCRAHIQCGELHEVSFPYLLLLRVGLGKRRQITSSLSHKWWQTKMAAATLLLVLVSRKHFSNLILSMAIISNTSYTHTAQGCIEAWTKTPSGIIQLQVWNHFLRELVISKVSTTTIKDSILPCSAWSRSQWCQRQHACRYSPNCSWWFLCKRLSWLKWFPEKSTITNTEEAGSRSETVWNTLMPETTSPGIL